MEVLWIAAKKKTTIGRDDLDAYVDTQVKLQKSRKRVKTGDSDTSKRSKTSTIDVRNIS